MTLDALKTEYKKSITLEGDDLNQIIEEIDEANTLEDFVAVVEMWSMYAAKNGGAVTILKRILQVE